MSMYNIYYFRYVHVFNIVNIFKCYLNMLYINLEILFFPPNLTLYKTSLSHLILCIFDLISLLPLE